MITQSTANILTSEIMLQKMSEVHSGKPWYGTSVCDLLCRVEPHYAFRGSPLGERSIASLLAHMIYWKRYVADVLQSSEGERDQNASWNWRIYGKAGAETWQNMVDEYNQLHRNILQWLEDHPVDPSTEVTGTRYNLRLLLEGIIEHDIYHIAQISQLTRYFEHQRDGWSLFRHVKGLAMW